MNTQWLRGVGALVLLLCTMVGAALAQQPASATTVNPPASVTAPADTTSDDFDEAEPRTPEHEGVRRHSHWGRHRRHGNDVVSIGHDSTLAAGQHADSVVSILGSSTSAGDAVDVVSILGNTRVTGPVTDSVVAVLGNVYVDSKVGDVAAVLGNVELGPHAEVDDVTAVLGMVYRDPAAIVHGGVENIVGGNFGDMTWLHTWIHHCLFYGRPLALVNGLAWAWALALGYLLFYVALALLFRPALSRCIQTVEAEPGHTVLAALVTMLLTPVIVVLLCVTLIGIAAVPFVVASLFCAGLFGKAVMLAWIGQRILGQRPGSLGHPAFAVAVGGALVLVLYLVPVLGFLVYKLLGFVGFGAVIYTLLSGVREHQLEKAEHLKTPAAAAGAAEGVAAASADGAASASAAGSNAGTRRAEAAPGASPAEGAAPAPGADTPQGASPSASSTPFVSAAMPRAGFWIRMAALLLDAVLIGVVLRLLHPLGHFHLVVLAVYGAVMWKLRGSTIGGMVFDLHVVRLDGRAVDWETAIVRALGCFLSLAVVGLGFIWIAFDPAHQAWHDKIAGTVVVRVPKV